METIIAALLTLIALLGGGPAHQTEPVWTQEDQIMFCADYYGDPFEALECMEYAEADPTLPTIAEVYGS